MTPDTLRIVRPLSITPAMMLASNVTETDYPEWASGTPYALDARVIVAAQHKVYQSLVAANTGNAPATSPTQWVEVSATNRWKAFDDSVSTQTKRASLLSYTIQPGQAIHSVAALNLAEATSMRVRVTDPGLGVIYDKTVPLAGQLINSNWWDWFFGERTQRMQSIYTDLPAAPAATITIDITGTNGLAVGVLVLGQMRQFSLGVQMGARVGFTDYSREEENEFGDVYITERPTADRAVFPLLLEASEVDAFLAFAKSVRKKPCLWIGSDRFEAMTVFGFPKEFDVLISYYDYANCDLELRGLT
jgi:hypothetical protein